MKSLSIAWKDLQILLKERGVVLQLFLLPLLFILVFSGALGALGEGEQDTRIPLAVVDQDGGETAQSLTTGIDTAGGVRVESYELAEAQTLVDENRIATLLIIPADFTDAISRGEPTSLRLISHPEAKPERTEAVRLVVEGVAQDMALEVQLLSALQQMGDMQGDSPETAQFFTVERTQAQARQQFEASRTRPLVSVSQREPGPAEGTESGEGQVGSLSLSDVAVPGMAVLFMFMTAQNAAYSIYQEKRVGTFRRLLAAPLSKSALLAGKLLPNLITSTVQAAVIFLFGILGLRLLGLTPTSLGAQPLVTILVLLLVALCSSAFGVTIAALAHTEGQIGGLSILLLWGMGILGGCLVPLFLLERFLGPVSKIVPHYWANHALINLMVRGLGFADVALDMAVLLGFTALFFGIGLWRIDFD